MTDNAYYTTTTGSSGLPIGGITNTPYTTSWTSTADYAEKKQVEAWMRILVERIDKLQDKIKELEGKSDGR
jgi:hypothetical protein